ncbi:MAG: dihydroxy-acid dehydratase, partial [Candidatus Omnitrophica bacterium]|nr:dihydroxy-acid dehydratase [Candidatus Omnitrophota bacterium]
MMNKLNRRSAVITEGPSRAPARAMMKAMGWTDADIKKPHIGIANTWIETMPCNVHLRRLSEKLKEGIRAAGGQPIEYNTIAVSDGITMGTEGMNASLISREVIADSIELVARGHAFDGLVALTGCDKTIPGAVMALARLDIPSLMIYGGSIDPGEFQCRDVTIQDVFEGVGKFAAGKISRKDFRALENAACPSAGACGGQFTANTMATAFAVMGISPMDMNAIPAMDPEKDHACVEAGRLVMKLVRRNLTARKIITRASIENAIRSVALTGGSTNAVLHRLAVAHEAGVKLRPEDFERLSRSVPLLGDLKPGGRFV